MFIGVFNRNVFYFYIYIFVDLLFKILFNQKQII